MKKFTSQEIKEFVSKPLFDEKIILSKDPSWPKISIVTVSYNQAEFLERTILSVLNQNYPNLEYIIIDGGSTDGSVEIIKKYEKYLAYWVSEHDKGIYDAMNKGIDLASGDFINFLNCGDYYVSLEALKSFVSEIKDLNKVYFARAIIEAEKESIRWKLPGEGVNISKWLSKYRTPNHQAILYPKLYYKNHFYEPSFKYFSDTDYTLRAYNLCRFQYVDMDFVVFGLGGVSNSPENIKIVWEQIKESLKLYKRHSDKFNFWYRLMTPFRLFLKFLVKKTMGRNFHFNFLKIVSYLRVIRSQR